MKFFLVCFVVLFAVAYGEVTRAAYKKYHDECKTETNTDEKEISKVLKGEEYDGKILAKHLLCMNKKFGVQKANGDFDVDAVRTKLRSMAASDDKVEEVVKNCLTKPEHASPEDVAVGFFKCSNKYVQLRVPAH